MHQPGRTGPLPDEAIQMARISCEIAGDIAAMLGLGPGAELALRSAFEAHDGGGVPGLLRGGAVPLATGVVAVASDLEIHSRVHGLEAALALVRGRAGGLYPSSLVEVSLPLAPSWIAELVAPTAPWAGTAGNTTAMRRSVGLELVADVIDLKLAWMTGYSRRVAGLARNVAVQLGLDEPMRRRAYRAGLIHGIGRAAVPDALWNAPGRCPHRRSSACGWCPTGRRARAGASKALPPKRRSPPTFSSVATARATSAAAPAQRCRRMRRPWR